MINDHFWEGSFYPRLPNGKRKKFNVYAESRDQCETKLAEMISEKKAEIAEEKAKLEKYQQMMDQVVARLAQMK